MAFKFLFGLPPHEKHTNNHLSTKVFSSLSMDVKLNLKFKGNWQFIRLLLDILLLAALLGCVRKFFKYWKKIVPGKPRGFFCNDESLMYPYVEVSMDASVFIVALSLPLIVFVLIEFCKWWGEQGSECKIRWSHFWPLYNAVRYFLFGFEAQSLLTKMAKATLGRLRPHFFALCQPTFGERNATCENERNQTIWAYHTDYTCAPRTPIEVSSSFFSGHAARAFYGLVFLALYLQLQSAKERKLMFLTNTLLRSLGQLLCLMFALVSSYLRVVEHHHHWSDVVAGSLVGSAVAYFLIRNAKST
ncbi:putative phosphatidate phosphatase [Scaptodrosophila lebanonensis]|uniref:Phosphatidate phosphatase n=1 Tax=Drosophila lebanonensis TaxID=7225 RepID=A0A6J2U4J7_DROLE|nr:putative phosphatidate phosphatase [Scaptodrosophila lebanonensis]